MVEEEEGCIQDLRGMCQQNSHIVRTDQAVTDEHGFFSPFHQRNKRKECNKIKNKEDKKREW